MNDLVSVIMTTHHEPLDMVADCVESLNKQTYKNCEFILVNDCSIINGVHEFLTYYSKTHDRFTYIYLDYNVGFARAKNIGMAMATGKYFSLIDADMEYTENFIEDAVYTFTQHPDCYHVYAPHAVFDSKSKDSMFVGNGHIEFPAITFIFPIIGAGMLLRDVLNDVGYFPTNMEISDNAFCGKLCVYAINKNLKQYGITHSPNTGPDIKHYIMGADLYPIEYYCTEHKETNIQSNINPSNLHTYGDLTIYSAEVFGGAATDFAKENNLVSMWS